MSLWVRWALGGAAALAGLLAVRRALAGRAAAPLDLGSPPPPPPSWWTDDDFRALAASAARLGLNPADLLLIEASESALNPHAAMRRADGSVIAGGLFGLTEAGAGAAGLSKADVQVFPNWTVAQQIPVAERFLKTALSGVAPPANAAVLYAYNFAPGHVRARGTALDTVLYTKGVDGAAYDLQRTVDHGGKGYITIRDLALWLRDKKVWLPAYRGALARLRVVTGNPALSPGLPV